MRAHGPASPGAGDQLVQALGDVITVARVPWKQRISAFATEELEIAVSTHAGTPEKILDNESRNRPVRGDDQGSLHTRLGVGQMISTLAAEYKAIFFKDGDEIPVVNRTNGGHLVSVNPPAGFVVLGILWECAARTQGSNSTSTGMYPPAGCLDQISATLLEERNTLYSASTATTTSHAETTSDASLRVSVRPHSSRRILRALTIR